MPLLKLRNANTEEIERVAKKDMKSPPQHMKLVSDAMALFGFQLLQNDDDSKEYFKESHLALPFVGNKILKLEKAADTTWVEKFMALNKAHYDFVVKNFEACLAWTGSQDFSEAMLAAGAPAAPQQQQQAPAPVEKKPVAAPVKKGPPAKRPPVKTKKGKSWVFENYDGEDILTEGDEYVDKTLVHNYFSCKNLNITVKGKIKAVNLEGCQKVTVFLDQVIGEVNIMNCKVVKIFGQEKLQTCTVENSNEVNLMLNQKTKDCKLFTTCVRSMWV